MRKKAICFCWLLLIVACKPAPAPGPAADAIRYVERVALVHLVRSPVSPIILDGYLDRLQDKIQRVYRVEVMAGRSLSSAFWPVEVADRESALFLYEQKLKQGMQALKRLQLRKSTDRFKEAMELLTMCGSRLSQRSLVDLYINRALAHLLNLEQKEAQTCFRQAIAFDPELDLSNRPIQAPHREVFDLVRRQVLSANPAQMEVQSEPPAARVFVNGKDLGPSPRQVELYPGRHFLRLELSGYGDWTATLPAGVPPPFIQATLYPAFRKSDLGDLVEHVGTEQDFSNKEIQALRQACSFYHVDALVFLVFSRDNQTANLRLTSQVFLGSTWEVLPIRYYDLGAKPKPKLGRKLINDLKVLKFKAKPEPKPKPKPKLELKPQVEPEPQAEPKADEVDSRKTESQTAPAVNENKVEQRSSDAAKKKKVRRKKRKKRRKKRRRSRKQKNKTGSLP